MPTDAHEIMFPASDQDDPDVEEVKRALVNIANVVRMRNIIRTVAKRRGMVAIRQGLTVPQRQRAVILMDAAKAMIAAIGETDPGDPPDDPDPVAV